MAVTVDDLRKYLNNPPDNKESLERYLSAARSRARGAGVPEYKNNANYDLFILALAASEYDNRGLSFSGSYQATAEENTRKLINSFVLELRYAGEDGEEAGP